MGIQKNKPSTTFRVVSHCWTTVIFCLGVFPVDVQATPPVARSLTEPNARIELIERLKHRDWELSKSNQELLWSLYWQSRLALLDEDPDIFERILDIQQSLARQSPKVFAKYFREMQSPVVVNTAETLLMEQGYLNATSLNATQRIEVIERINRASEPYLTQPNQWLHCWKSSGGSVGFELYRLTLIELSKTITDSVANQRLVESYNLTAPPKLSCPDSAPGQVVGVPVPTEPIPNIVPPRKPTPKGFAILAMICIALLCWVMFRKYKLKFIASVVVVTGLELLVGLFVTPLRETTPWFSTANWQVVPWVEKNGYYYTEGSYLRAQKIPKTTKKRRLVILGASSAHGSNELWEDSFAGILDTSTEWDVVNLGIGGTTSAGLVSLLPYIKELKPDAVLIYYGHNEMHQIRQLTNVSSAQLTLYPLQHMLRASSVYSWLYTVIKPSETGSRTVTPSSQVPPVLSQQELTMFAQRHFESNIMVLLEQLSATPTLLLNPPTNYPFAPMQYSPSMPTTIQEAQHRIDKHPSSTTIHSSIQESIHHIVEQYPVYFWDLDAHFHKNSPDGISANGLFWDELHPSALGHRWIANGLQNWLQTIINEELEP